MLNYPYGRHWHLLAPIASPWLLSAMIVNTYVIISTYLCLPKSDLKIKTSAFCYFGVQLDSLEKSVRQSEETCRFRRHDHMLIQGFWGGRGRGDENVFNVNWKLIFENIFTINQIRR